MKKTLVLIAALVSLSAVAAAPAPTYRFISAEQIVTICKNTENQRD